jgi:hypothetical protein
MRWADAARAAVGLSYADIVRATEDAIKTALIEDREVIKNADLTACIRERKATIAGGSGTP